MTWSLKRSASEHALIGGDSAFFPEIYNNCQLQRMIITLWRTILIKFFIYFEIYAKYDPMNHIQGEFNLICCVILGKRGRLWCHVISPWYFPYNGEIKFKPYEKKKNKSAVF